MNYFIKSQIENMSVKYKQFNPFAAKNPYFPENGLSYSEYNYLKPGIISWIKRWHFEAALKLTQRYFHNCNVIDFGCADGIFLLSLSNYFNHVLGVDKNYDLIKAAFELAGTMDLGNVELICNDGLTINNIKSILQDKKYHILYLLETLEHIGDRNFLYESKINFLKEIAGLIDDEGIIIISVPKMTGIFFLLQRIGLALCGLYRDPISISSLLKASFLDDTTEMEKLWNGGHLGFNHKKLEGHLKKDFRIIKKKDLLWQVIYVIRK